MRRLSVDSLKPGMVLARSVFSGNGHLLLTAGTEITDRYVAILRSRGLTLVDIHDPDTDDIEIQDIISERTRMNVSLSTYRILSAVERATSPFRSQDYPTLQGELSSDDFARQARDAFGYEELITDMSDIVDEVAAQALLPGIQTIRSFDSYLFLHSIDTTIVALMIGRRLGFDRARLHQLAAGCILHDIGMVMIEPAIIQKQGKLDAGELVRVRQHPRLGYDMLRQLRPREVIPNHVAYQHHERQDAQGYPRGLHGSGRVKRSELERHGAGRILLDAEICAVADVYDALGADRPYRPALPPDQVVHVMRGLAGSHLNREIVTHLLEIVPVYPLGSEVVVKTGAFAGFGGVVAKVDRRKLDRPILRLLTDKEGQRIDPIELDLTREDVVIASAATAPAQPQPARPGSPTDRARSSAPSAGTTDRGRSGAPLAGATPDRGGSSALHAGTTDRGISGAHAAGATSGRGSNAPPDGAARGSSRAPLAGDTGDPSDSSSHAAGGVPGRDISSLHPTGAVPGRDLSGPHPAGSVPGRRGAAPPGGARGFTPEKTTPPLPPQRERGLGGEGSFLATIPEHEFQK
jgi:HD-GYP domain-containing protein (c-di-GMP phosphodiesterase class II)